METSVKAVGLTKKFGAFTAVDDVGFQVEKGEIFGFLGPNGAGKSTTIRMLCGILEPSGGSATVGGFDVARQPDLIKENIGYMSQKFSLYNDLTVIQNIDFFAGIYNLSRRKKAERLAWSLKMSGLEGLENMLTANLSGGWKQRLSLACSILHEPQIIFLDEPTAGVDPISRRDFWELIYEFAYNGVTVFVTTHYMDEAEHCDRLVMIYNGKKIAEGSPAEFKDKLLTCDLIEVACSDQKLAIDLIGDLKGVSRVSIFGDSLHVLTADSESFLQELPDVLKQKEIALNWAEPIEKSLEDAFIEAINQHDAQAAKGGEDAL